VGFQIGTYLPIETASCAVRISISQQHQTFRLKFNSRHAEACSSCS